MNNIITGVIEQNVKQKNIKEQFLDALQKHKEIETFLQNEDLIDCFKNDVAFTHLCLLTCVHHYKTGTFTDSGSIGIKIREIPVSYLEKFHQALIEHCINLSEDILIKAFNHACENLNLPALTYLQEKLHVIDLVAKQHLSSLKIADLVYFLYSPSTDDQFIYRPKDLTIRTLSYEEQNKRYGNYHGFLMACNKNIFVKTIEVRAYFLDSATFVSHELLEVAIVVAIKNNNNEIAYQLTDYCLNHNTGMINIADYSEILDNKEQKEVLDKLMLTIKLFHQKKDNNQNKNSFKL